ncbi:hypothetical protein CALVIDRAFT_567152 [Calocera viscosa TUFC12733]|uniref:BBC1/AIM3 cysteine proteinase-fold domain-containing protein n=1 Tax=Calocera viscosa (strain TUFC12733) TaxID=1330018 RepID=A0A167IHZ8_CALVF|nr:hypothetical protein CALVIDRAFT_567152 [Calocera viscosa TUFC12733]
MSDTPETPPKPKIGSLRDRIAAFESKPAAAPAPAPAPRLARQWKPKPVDPPAHPSTAGDTSPTATERKTSGFHSGMSASDARDSIQRTGGSLKERMAALQGAGAFGPAGGAASPPPVAAKPREWKRPIVSTPATEEHTEGPAADVTVKPPARSPTVHSDEAKTEAVEHSPSTPIGHDETSKSPIEQSASPPAVSAETHEVAGDAEGEAPEKTEEELEHERRAAIAARMARLGGARVGMAPMFGGPKPKLAPKPVVHEHAPEAEMEEKTTEEPKHERIAVLPVLPKIASPPVSEAEMASKSASIEAEGPKDLEAAHARDHAEPTPESKAETQSSHTSADVPVVSPGAEVVQDSPVVPHDAASPAGVDENTEHAAASAHDTPSAPPKQHITMPMPAAPRRTGPPRRNRAPPPPPPEEEEKLLDSDQVAVKEAEGVKEDLLAAKEVEGPQLGPTETEPAVEGESHEEAPVEEAEEPKDVSPPQADAPVQAPAVGTDIKEDINGAAGVEVHDVGPTQAAQPLIDNDIKEDLHEPTAPEEAAEQQGKDDKPVTKEPTENQAVATHHEPSAEEPTTTAGPIVDELRKDVASESGAPVAPEIPDTAVAPGGFSLHGVTSDEPGSVDNAPTAVSTDETKPAEEDEDEEAARRHRVAERMQKLGGVSFGMPVSSFPAKKGSTSSIERKTPVVSPVSDASTTILPTITQTVHAEPEQLTEEEEELAHDAEIEDGKLGHEEISSGGQTLGIPHEPTPYQTAEYREEELAHDEEIEASQVEEPIPVTTLPTRSLPPPPPPRDSEALVNDESEDEEFEDAESAADRSVDVGEEEEMEKEVVNHHEEEVEGNNVGLKPAVSSLSDRPGRSLPPPPPPPPADILGEEDEAEEETEETPTEEPEDAYEVAVTHANHDAPSLPAGVSQTIVQKPLTDEQTVEDEPGQPAVVLVNTQAMVYDDDEPDPIDPTFYSPPSRQASSGSLPKVSLQASGGTSPSAATGPSAASGTGSAEFAPAPAAIEAPEPAEEDEEQGRRQTIAARMAKLGGLRFGVPPSLPPKRTAPPAPREEETTDPEAEGALEHDPTEPKIEVEASTSPSEETEYARRQAILARLVAGGGRGFSMAPQLAPPAPMPVFNRSVTEDNIAETAGSTEAPVENKDATADADEGGEAPPPPPRFERAVPPPVRQPTADAVPRIPPSAPSRQLPSVQPASSAPAIQVETVDGEDEFEDAQEEEEEGQEEEEEEPAPPPLARSTRTALPPLPSSDVPPPLPPGRRSSSSIPDARPPVPHAAPPPPPARDASLPQRGSSGHSGFVSIDSSYGIGGGSIRSPITNRDVSRERAISPSKSFASPTETSLSQWELPEIPSASLGLGEHTVTTLSSWSEDDSMYAAAAEPPAPPPPPKVSTLPDLDTDQLMILWGSVGTRVLQAALQLQEQSKRAVIGDGSGDGLVLAALDMVPSAMKPLTPHAYGHLIFAMSGQSLQRRTSDIMEGDVAVITDAEFKGRRGLVPYHQHVGSASDPLVGIVHEFEPKNSKIRVLTASQHPNHYPTIESVSYRLEDLKQGTFKVYRIAQA